MKAATKSFSRQNGTGSLVRTRGLPRNLKVLPSIVSLQAWRFKPYPPPPPPGYKLKTSLYRSCLVCKVSVFSIDLYICWRKRKEITKPRKLLLPRPPSQKAKVNRILHLPPPPMLTQQVCMLQHGSYSCNVTTYGNSMNTCLVEVAP